MGIRIRKNPDRSGGLTALASDLPGAPPGRWPLASVEFVEERPGGGGLVATDQGPDTITQLPTHLVQQGLDEGWIEGEGHEVVTRPAGPPDDQWRPTANAPGPHVFHHYSHLTIAGVRYRVTHQPDKYAAEGDDTTKVTKALYGQGATRVDWFYDLEREDAAGG